MPLPHYPVPTIHFHYGGKKKKYSISEIFKKSNKSKKSNKTKKSKKSKKSKLISKNAKNIKNTKVKTYTSYF